MMSSAVEKDDDYKDDEVTWPHSNATTPSA